MIFENVQQQFRQQEHKCAQGETDGIMVYCIVITSSKELTNVGQIPALKGENS
jgi:hypothetical protein